MVNRSNRRRQKPAPRKPRQRQSLSRKPKVENLESRQLMAADLLLEAYKPLPSPPENEPAIISRGGSQLEIGGGAQGRTGNVSAGDFDPSFGVGGFVQRDFGNSGDQAYSIAIQNGGKIIAAGGSTYGGGGGNFALARFHPDGSPDNSFGGIGTAPGTVVTDVVANNHESVHSVLIQPDGKILAAGVTSDGYAQLAVIVRYLENGTLDEEFGDSGRVILEGDQYIEYDVKAFYEQDKIFVWSDNHVTRLNLDGSLDHGFGAGGEVNTGASFDLSTKEMIIDDGMIYLSGGVDGQAVVRRLHANGSVDHSFGTSGIVQLPEGHLPLFDFFIDSEGRFVSFRSDRISRYQPDGTLDNGPDAFNVDGIYELNEMVGVGMTRHPGGMLTVVGQRTNTMLNDELIVIRLDSNGALDHSFGNGGIVEHTVLPSQTIFPHAVQGFTNGNVLIAGGFKSHSLAPKDFILTRVIGSNTPEFEDPTEGLKSPEAPEEHAPQMLEKGPAQSFASNGSKSVQTESSVEVPMEVAEGGQRVRAPSTAIAREGYEHPVDALFAAVGSLDEPLTTVLAPARR